MKSTAMKLICSNPAPSQNPKDPPRSEKSLAKDKGGYRDSVVSTVWSKDN